MHRPAPRRIQLIPFDNPSLAADRNSTGLHGFAHGLLPGRYPPGRDQVTRTDSAP